VSMGVATQPIYEGRQATWRNSKKLGILLRKTRDGGPTTRIEK